MAKKKLDSNIEIGVSPDHCLWIQVPPGTLSGLEVGDTITLVIKGKVAGLEERESYDDPKKINAEVRVKNYDVLVDTSNNVFEELAEEDEDE